MHRRFQRLAAVAVLALSACATTAGHEFVSDRISVVARGSGPDVILIPGLTGHREDAWGGVIETLDDDGNKLIEHYRLEEGGARLVRQIDIFRRGKPAHSIIQRYERA